MFGFVFGTLCLVGLFKVAGFGRWRHGGRWGARRFWLRRLFERLDATPGQEKVISKAVEDVERVAHRLYDAVPSVRADLARGLRGEHVDHESLQGAFGRLDANSAELKEAITQGIRSVHEALNPEQRRTLADLIEHGPRPMYGYGCGHGRGWGGGYGRGGAETVRL